MPQTFLCSLSRLPIGQGTPVVAIPVEPERYAGTDSERFPYIPSGWPILGKLDSTDGVFSLHQGSASTPLPKCSIVFHASLWNNYMEFWHPSNTFTSRWLNVQKVLDNPRPSKYDGPTSAFYYILAKQFTLSDTGLLFRNLIDSQRNVGNVGKDSSYSFLQRSPFMERIVHEMLDGTWTDESLDTLTRMVVLLSSSEVTQDPPRPITIRYGNPAQDHQAPIRDLYARLAQDLAEGSPYAHRPANVTAPFDEVLDSAFGVSSRESMSLDSLFVKLAEEHGECATERLIEQGLKDPSKGGDDGVRGEAVDVMLMGLSIFVKHGGSRQELLNTFAAKSAKWAKTLATQQS
jgi:hypothetical protein